MTQSILALGTIAGAFSNIPLGTKILLIGIIAAVIFASKGGKGGSSKSGGSSGSTGGTTGGTTPPSTGA